MLRSICAKAARKVSVFKQTIIFFQFKQLLHRFYLSMKGHVLRNQHINSFEASILLAYSIFARESNALLYTFTEDPNQLTPLHGMLSKKNFNRAMDMCEALAVKIQFFEESICLHFF